MRFLPRSLLLCALAATAVATARANVNVRVDTPVGSMTLELYDEAKPVTVTNFLRYIRDGLYEDTFAHRLPPGFVLQGGSIYPDANGSLFYIPTYSPIINEAGPFPEYSNVKGTIVMAKVDGNPDSATSSWFINLKDNNTGTAESGNLDLQNEGFTVFGAVTSGMTVVDRFAAFTPYGGTDGEDLIFNAGGVISQLPVKEIVDGQALISNLIFTTWTILDSDRPVITSRSWVEGAVGKPLTYAITSTNSPTAFDVTDGPLPDGLSLNAATGVISGIPTEVADTTVTVNATGIGGTGGASLTIYVAEAPPPAPSPIAPTPPSVTTKKKVTGKGGKVTLKGSASAGTVKVEVKAGKGGFKKAKGSPSNWKFPVKKLKPGNYKFKVRATNAAGQSTISTVKVAIRS